MPNETKTELDEFIKEALLAIVRGIKNGQSDADLGHLIAPLIQGEKRQDSGIFYVKDEPDSQATKVDFEVSVVAERTQEGKGGVGAKFKIWILNADAKLEGRAERQDIKMQKLSFTIPVKIPTISKNSENM